MRLGSERDSNPDSPRQCGPEVPLNLQFFALPANGDMTVKRELEIWIIGSRAPVVPRIHFVDHFKHEL
jgi:hypothetical protein